MDASSRSRAHFGAGLDSAACGMTVAGSTGLKELRGRAQCLLWTQLTKITSRQPDAPSRRLREDFWDSFVRRRRTCNFSPSSSPEDW